MSEPKKDDIKAIKDILNKREILDGLYGLLSDEDGIYLQIGKALKKLYKAIQHYENKYGSYEPNIELKIRLN